MSDKGKKLYLMMCSLGTFIGRCDHMPAPGEDAVLTRAFAVLLDRNGMAALPDDTMRLRFGGGGDLGVFVLSETCGLAKAHKAAVQGESLKRAGLVGPDGGGLN